MTAPAHAHRGCTAWLIPVLALALLALPAPARADGEAALWQALRSGGHVLVMRHALAPGTGDPAGFRIDDCATQRNLSEEGRLQARQTGALLRQREVAIDAVLSSRWCRCLETARLLEVGPVQPEPMLNSFFQDRGKGPAQTVATRARIDAFRGSGNLLLVTHQVNTTALTGVHPVSGAMVVLKPQPGGGFEVLGTLAAR